jgi:hypothetical protein
MKEIEREINGEDSNSLYRRVNKLFIENDL